ncbi:methionyl-tRNA formyltransferase [Buchnera aphidicola]|uniref:methionyl-tRNA formyltransferase n=1 Tax=Buchnera aphidicola TaxID=9 RepID=UPI0034645311
MNESKLKIIFAGTSQFSADHLSKLILSKYNIIAVLTKPDMRSGRGKKIIKSPIKILSENYQIPIFQPKQINQKNNLLDFLKIEADIMIVVAYGFKIPNFLLTKYRLGCINVHASLLPRWRGASPIQSAILNGDHQTGITIIQMNHNIDEGKILSQITCNIQKKDNTINLTKKLSHLGQKILIKTLQKIQNKQITPKPQNHKKSKNCIKIQKYMGKINFYIHAKKIEKMVRAFNPWPGTYLIIKNKIIKIWEVDVLESISMHNIGEIINIDKYGIQIQTKKNILNLKKIQISGKKIVTTSEFINSTQKIFIKGDII